MRTLGNIRLIAELFKKSVVSEKIVQVCIQDLMGDAKSEPSEDNVEVGPSLAAHQSPVVPIQHMYIKTSRGIFEGVKICVCVCVYVRMNVWVI